ncbi:MAG: ImmA/IrrE family metallo-endopeptidase [Veillonella sp.]|jgi:putative toxin-antitoxin system, toxin component|nr:ImmA/IrrE family metallo-endopeptidase [Veillonella sp.]
MAGLSVPPLSLKQIRKRCELIRRIFNIPLNAPIDIVKVFEYILTQIGVEFEIVPKHEMGAKHGETIPSENRIRIREDVYERACYGHGRDRLTMAHELGHLLLHRVETITFAREDGDIPPYKDPEWQANAFAGELLAPYEYIKDMSIIDIASHYGITEKAASIQRRRK